MTLLDVFILVFAILMAFYGYLQGFIVGALSLAGFALGAVIGSHLGPLLLSDSDHSPYAPLFGLFGALLAGGLLAVGFEGFGSRLRRAVRLPGIGVLDGVLGALLTACIALGVTWIAGAVALQTPGVSDLRRDVQRSQILQRLNELLPPSGDILHALARVDPLPALEGPNAAVAPPRAAIARKPRVRAAAGSVVRVLGTACGLGVEGSGWVVAPHIVVTNAHVVAGEQDTTVQPGGDGPHLEVRVVAFDSDNDVAVLRVPGLDAPALPLASSPDAGTSAAVLGFPENGPYTVRAARLGEEQPVTSDDAYGRGPIRRRIVPFRGLVQPGNSGGPMVDAKGRVVATVFAATRGSVHRGGLAVPNSLVRSALARAGGQAVSTHACAQ